MKGDLEGFGTRNVYLLFMALCQLDIIFVSIWTNNWHFAFIGIPKIFKCYHQESQVSFFTAYTLPEVERLVKLFYIRKKYLLRICCVHLFHLSVETP